MLDFLDGNVLLLLGLFGGAAVTWMACSVWEDLRKDSIPYLSAVLTVGEKELISSHGGVLYSHKTGLRFYINSAMYGKIAVGDKLSVFYKETVDNSLVKDKTVRTILAYTFMELISAGVEEI